MAGNFPQKTAIFGENGILRPKKTDSRSVLEEKTAISALRPI
jgi:hypothetical protein